MGCRCEEMGAAKGSVLSWRSAGPSSICHVGSRRNDGNGARRRMPSPSRGRLRDDAVPGVAPGSRGPFPPNPRPSPPLTSPLAGTHAIPAPNPKRLARLFLEAFGGRQRPRVVPRQSGPCELRGQLAAWLPGSNRGAVGAREGQGVCARREAVTATAGHRSLLRPHKQCPGGLEPSSTTVVQRQLTGDTRHRRVHVPVHRPALPWDCETGDEGSGLLHLRGLGSALAATCGTASDRIPHAIPHTRVPNQAVPWLRGRRPPFPGKGKNTTLGSLPTCGPRRQGRFGPAGRGGRTAGLSPLPLLSCQLLHQLLLQALAKPGRHRGRRV